MEETGVRLLWGTANLFGHPRYAAGAATNPDPEVFAFAGAQVKHCLEVTKRLNGEDGLGAIYPAMANAVMMYDALGYPEDHPNRAIAR